ncbi:hypothetical protein NCS55_00445900 [Fusarium keratoplasticum]|nr:hypothetical protein NCS55_00445900 [Fusarium keratoplasticum]
METPFYPSSAHSFPDTTSEISALHAALSDVLEYVGQIRFIAATAEAAIERIHRRLDLLEEIASETSSTQAPTTPTGPAAPWKEDETDFEGDNMQIHDKGGHSGQS